MDGLIFIIIAIVFVILDNKYTVDDETTEEAAYEIESRVAKLNEDFYDDPNAFSKIINALGFPKGDY